MNLLTYSILHFLAGWLAGKAFATLSQARAAGALKVRHWLIVLISISAGMLFARFVIGGARSWPEIPDTAVGICSIAMLAVFVWSSGISQNRRGR